MKSNSIWECAIIPGVEIKKLRKPTPTNEDKNLYYTQEKGLPLFENFALLKEKMASNLQIQQRAAI